ncbi:hypothetical protein ST201phi2-1p106 [Pseudomonas phage 201phi2-1]|uniref:Uncharacterized protein n=1 Tax=Pseudomonas phage 201phi2-1 TaxID=198110 RepID=B3FIW9_BP201|nr:hypothetical protein ST201phi2-1p106 [Pseudomonas phage 201phi2-1]ABY62938.1 hypothetical protein 201phi2-1p106 [Pseudomonas phage 201phi2-1]
MRVARFNDVEPERIVPLVNASTMDNFYPGDVARLVTYVDHVGLTAPLKFGKRFDLLGMAGEDDPFKVIDPAMCIETVYFKVNDVLYAGYAKGEKGNVTQAHLLGDTRRVTIDWTHEHVYMDSERPAYFDGVDTSKIPVGVFQFNITGEVQISKGIVEFNATVIEQSEGLNVELVGYDLLAYYSKNSGD